MLEKVLKMTNAQRGIAYCKRRNDLGAWFQYLVKPQALVSVYYLRAISNVVYDTDTFTIFISDLSSIVFAKHTEIN